jgi:hypothetical protein
MEKLRRTGSQVVNKNCENIPNVDSTCPNIYNWGQTIAHYNLQLAKYFTAFSLFCHPVGDP